MDKANFPVNCVERNFKEKTFYLDTREPTKVKVAKSNAPCVVHHLCTSFIFKDICKECILTVALLTSIVKNVMRHSALVER